MQVEPGKLKRESHYESQLFEWNELKGAKRFVVSNYIVYMVELK